MSTHSLGAWIPADTFASRLVLLRRGLDLTVKQAAEKAGIHYATWSTWENGRKPVNLDDVVRQISGNLGVDRDWLMWGGALRPDGGPSTDLRTLDYKAADQQWLPVLVSSRSVTVVRSAA